MEDIIEGSEPLIGEKRELQKLKDAGVFIPVKKKGNKSPFFTIKERK